MFDAAAAATASEVASEQVAQEQADAAVSTETSHETTSAATTESQDVLNALATYMPTESRTEVAFVDPTVPDYQALLAGMDPNIEVIMLNGGQDGIEQMASALSGRTGIDAIHLISHGNSGELQLGTGRLNIESMSGQYADELAIIQQSLSEQADILVYGCDFAEGDAGELAVNRLAELTGADVEASNDLTGHTSLGGDWDLEVKTGSIETRIAIDTQVQADWVNLLAAPVLDALKSPMLNSVSEDSGAPSGTVGTLVSSLVDFANPAGQVDNVTDADAGAQLGIAITTANTTNGIWWYSRDNGSTWNALGAVSEGSARLLAADANTRLYFQANADYNGTLSDAITFRAWDQTSGTAGSTADLTGAANTVKDQFSSASYSNNNGTANWSGNWVESDSNGGGASGGRIQISGGQLDIRADAVNDGIYRQVNLSNATSATLSFSYNNSLGNGDQIAVQVSSNGGASYTTLSGGVFSNSAHTGSGTISFDITSAISANTQVRFLVTAQNANNHLYVDNVQRCAGAGGYGTLYHGGGGCGGAERGRGLHRERLYRRDHRRGQRGGEGHCHHRDRSNERDLVLHDERGRHVDRSRHGEQHVGPVAGGQREHAALLCPERRLQRDEQRRADGAGVGSDQWDERGESGSECNANGARSVWVGLVQQQQWDSELDDELGGDGSGGRECGQWGECHHWRRIAI
jgi:hypothetical protein